MKDFAQYIGPALTALVVPLMLGWMLRSANAKAKTIDGVTWLEYGKAIKGFTLFFVGVVVALVVTWFNVADKDKSAVLGIIGLFGGLTLPMIIEFFLVRIGYDSEHIYCFSGWRPKRQVNWKDIQSASFSPSMQWWVIETRNSGKVRASVFLTGLRDLLQEINKRGIKIA